MATPNSTQQKPIHSLVIDTGPLINNAVSISTIINSAEELFTTPAILSEIRDEATRSRVQTTLMPFLKIRNPSPASYDAVIAFSKKTGDHAVLSRQDLGILALAYEVHCERNGGDWGLRDAPKQPIKRRPGEEQEQKELKSKQPRQRRTKEVEPVEVEVEAQPAVEEGWEQPRGKRAIKGRFVKPPTTEFTLHMRSSENQDQQNGEPTITDEAPDAQGGIAVTQEQVAEQNSLLEPVASDSKSEDVQNEEQKEAEIIHQNTPEDQHQGQSLQKSVETESATELATEFATESAVPPQEASKTTLERVQELSKPLSAPIQEISDSTQIPEDVSKKIADLDISTEPQQFQQPTPPATDSSDNDSDGDWITPSNLPAHQAKDSGVQSHSRTAKAVQMDVATMTIDFAMQNVLLQMNLNLLSTNMQRIKHLTTKVLRCHACFNIVKQMDKQFCPRCGQATLHRVSCSTDAKGEFRIHLAKNYQYNTRGDKYSVPKPIAGTANGKWSGQGGGKGGWGRDLILAEDQKEYQQQVDQDKRSKMRDLMDADYLPGILTGDRGRAGGRPKIGAGKNVNSKKRA
ncbi:Nin one binding Zn-ribbon like-domain-containing protein [Pyrenochaeta sp. MPI-SDFR-AT-0127]|nr:Nin one binding Zn-ribbon like-domain-containing protein [Pyrenochaeta sp. MPI-SDFR-AT-0127]